MVNKINISEMFALLLEALPNAKNDWEKHLQDYEDDDLPYVGIAAFARHLVEMTEHCNTETFPKVFETVEKLIKEGDEEVRGLMIVGFLESLQNISSWTNKGSKIFIEWLQPETLKAWNELEIIWNGKSNLADVIRDELNQKK